MLVGMQFKPQVNSVRAVAVILVLIEHSLSDLYRIKSVGPGFLGVRLFFVISGYLITGILLGVKESLIQRQRSLAQVLGQFYARRFLRIFPLYYLLLLLLFLAGTAEFLSDWPWYVSYLSNVLVVRANHWIPLLSHFWSLAVEEQFYIFWPLLVLLTPVHRLPWLIGSFLLIGMISRGGMAALGYGGVAVRSLTTSCFDILGAGALLAWVERYRPTFFPSLLRLSLLFGGGLFALMLALRLNEGSWLVRAIFLDFSAALLFIWVVGQASQGAFPTFFEHPGLGYIGKVSYGIYLIHPLLPRTLEAVERTTGLPSLPALGWFHFCVLSGFSVLAASVSWHCFENPINQLKKHFPY